jgi:hypothetical protein
VEHPKPLPHLQMVAHSHNSRSHLLPPRRRRTHSCLRSTPFPIAQIRKSCEQKSWSRTQYVFVPHIHPISPYTSLPNASGSDLSLNKVEAWAEILHWNKALLVDGERITETTPFLWSGHNHAEINKSAHVVKALFYAVQNFYAFMLM